MTTPVHGCMMSHSLYVKSNGEMPCWDAIGETLALRILDEAALQDNRESPIFYGLELQHIRQSFMDGRDPHPGLCEFCVVRGHNGIETVLHPRAMELLHLEASYLCHLSCPQCIPANIRKSLKGPPYNMTPGFLDGLLRQLRREGVEHIRVIHFEGRGDPLVNARLPDLIETSKRHFPKSLVGLTTHCSYPYMPWIVGSGLDLLRASIDGATPESYLKYRVGGSFERAIDFLARLRDDRARVRSSLQVEWKYILFEWNDTEREMQLAAELAKELQVHLTFVRTHTPGRSQRFQTDGALHAYVRRLIPSAIVTETFDLRSKENVALSAVTAEHAHTLLLLALERIRAGDDSEAAARLAEAMKYDPEISVSGAAGVDATLRECLPQILADARFPSTLTGVAALSRELGDTTSSDLLLSRYLELAPNAPDRTHILSDRFIRTAVQHAAEKRFESARSYLKQAMDLELGAAPDSEEGPNFVSYLERVLHADGPPSLVVGAAIVASAHELYPAARALWQRYLAIAPGAPDRQRVLELIADIDACTGRKASRSTLSSRVISFVRCVFSRTRIGVRIDGSISREVGGGEAPG